MVTLGFSLQDMAEGGAAPVARGEPAGFPQGGRRGTRRVDRGTARPRPVGGRFGPLWGPFDQEEGGPRRRRGGTPQGCPVPGSGIVDNLGYPQPFFAAR